MKNDLKIVYSLIRLKKYPLAINKLEKLEKEKLLYPEVLVLKGLCIYLSNKNDNYSLIDIKKLYKKALSIDAEYVNALLELGHHYFAIDDKSDKAIPQFEKAIRILKSQITDAVTGLAKCIEESKSPKEAINFLKNSTSKIIDESKISKLIKEFEDAE